MEFQKSFTFVLVEIDNESKSYMDRQKTKNRNNNLEKEWRKESYIAKHLDL